jgi:hypothetical protein
MPRPLLVLFAVATVIGLGIVAYALVFPPSSDIPVEQRRPPGTGTRTHDTGRVATGEAPSPLPEYDPPCEAVATARPVGGVLAVRRLREVLELVCTIAGPGVPAEVTEAVGGLAGTTIEFAGFARTGVESTADIGTRRIWLNAKFSETEMPVREVVPVLLHEAWHLARPDIAVTAVEEYRARVAEHETCRQLISREDWPRWCHDAASIVVAGPELLVRGGYPGLR